MQRSGLLASWLVLALAVFLLTFEGWLPGQALLPLAPGDFPAWQVNAEERVFEAHERPNANMSDVLHLLIPALANTREALARGELPGWDGSQALGTPALAQLMHGLFYPPAWLPLAFGVVGLGLLASLHLLVAASGTMLYLRAIGRSPAAAVLGAVGFAFGAWMTARLQAWPVVGAAVWLPWILLGLERAARGEARFGYGLAGLATALSLLAGFPQVSLLILSLVSVLELTRWFWRARRERRDRRRGDRRSRDRRSDEGHSATARADADDPDEVDAFHAPSPQPLESVRRGDRRGQQRERRRSGSASGHAWRAFLALALGGLIAAPLWVPTLDYVLTESDRGALGAEALASEFMELPLLHHLLVPDYYASARLAGANPIALGALEQARLPVLVNRAETSLAVGVVSLLLALAAMVFGRHWLTRTWSAVVLAVLLLLLWQPALRAAVSVLPPLQFGSPRRLLLLVSFGLAVLAAGGLDLLRQAQLRVAIFCWGGALVVTAWALLLFTSIPPVSEEGDLGVWVSNLTASLDEPSVTEEVVRSLVPLENFQIAAEEATDGALIALLMGGLALLVFRPRAASGERGWVTSAERYPGVLVAVLLVELLLIARPLLRPVRTDAVSPAPANIAALHVPPLASALRGVSTAEGVPTRFVRMGDGKTWLRPGFAGLFGLSDVSAYLPMLPRRTARFMELVAPRARLSGSHLGGLSKPEQLLSPLVRLLALDAVLTDDAALEVPGWSQRERVGDVRILAPDAPQPRARVVPAVRVIEDPTTLLKQLLRPSFDPDAEACVGASIAGLLETPDASLPRRGVSLQRVESGRMELSVESGAPGLLVVSETFHGAWVAELDGVELDIVPANLAFLGVVLPGGEGGQLVLRFASSAPTVGLLIGALGLLALGWTTRRGPLAGGGGEE